MPAISRVGDTVLSVDGSGYQCGNPMETAVGEANTESVYCNGILVPVIGNKVAPHPKGGCSTDESTLSVASSTVFIGSLGIGRIGDQYGPNTITQGSSNCFSS